MRQRHIAILVGLTVVAVLGLAVLWEFAIGDALLPHLVEDHAGASTAERWYVVAVAVGVALVSLAGLGLAFLFPRGCAEQDLDTGATTAGP